MRCLVVLAVALAPAPAPAIAQTAAFTPTGQVNEVNVARSQLVYHPMVRGQPAAIRDFLFLDRVVRVTIDGRPARCEDLRKGDLFTYQLGANGRVVVLIALTPEAARAAVQKAENERGEAAAAGRRADVAALTRANAAEYARRLEALHAAHLASLRRQSELRTGRPADLDRKAWVLNGALASVAHLGGAWMASDQSPFKSDHARAIAALVARKGRDYYVEMCVQQLAPNLNPVVQRGIQRAITQLADGNLTVKRFGTDTAIGELKELLKRENVPAATAVGVLDTLLDFDETLQDVRDNRR